MDGILLVDKPLQWTSHDVVGCVRGRTREKKVGHAGTLDPLATGLLVLLLGKSTRLSASLMSDSKEYIGTITLGIRTDTDDREGKVLETHDASTITREEILEAIKSFTGPIKQVPPAYSAVKKDGQKLYDLARKGIAITVPPKSVTVEAFEMTGYKNPEFSFRIACSKGTYIRSLARDLGIKLGCGGSLSSLVRTRSGKYHLKDAVSGEALKRMTADEIGKLVR